jgi:hypothetical protein
VAGGYARRLLTDLGVGDLALDQVAPEHPAESWARSGAMALTGTLEGPPLICPVSLAACAQGVARAFEAVAGRKLPADLDPALLLGERAAISGYHRRGRVSAGGSCRLLKSGDGWVALNLPRDEDWALLPALFCRDLQLDWDGVAEAAAERPSGYLVDRGREMGLAIAESETPASKARCLTVIRPPPAQAQPRAGRPVVVDLSALWAGPLCGHLLRQVGARVIKVESLSRPDGARAGPAAFFDLLNAGKACVALDLKTSAGRDRLRALLRAADIVIESSRPRALTQLGISAEELIAERPGLCWISITGYGRLGDFANWIAFGDDAGVAAGLSRLVSSVNGDPLFCGDAIGDPLTGLHAALIALARWRLGKGGVVSVSMRDVLAFCIAFDPPASVSERTEAWTSRLMDRGIAAARPRARTSFAAARPLGADTNAVFADLGLPC